MRAFFKLLLLVATLALHACGDGKSLPCRCGGSGSAPTRCGPAHPVGKAPEQVAPAQFDNPDQAEQDAGSD